MSARKDFCVVNTDIYNNERHFQTKLTESEADDLVTEIHDRKYKHHQTYHVQLTNLPLRNKALDPQIHSP